MSEENEHDLSIEFNENPTPGTFQKLIKHLRDNKKIDVAREIRFNYISKFSMNEEMWIQWLEDEYKPQGDNLIYNQLLQMALNDLPLSANLRKFQIERSSEKNKLQLIEKAIEAVGDFDNSIWDLYRKEKPDKFDEIYEMQLSRPIPNYDKVFNEYQQQKKDKSTTFQPKDDVKERIDKLKLHRADFNTLNGAIEHVKTSPDVKTFEYALSLYPYSSQLWIEYLNHFTTESLAARAVRFCPTSGLLWATYAKISHKDCTAGFQFIKDQTEAQLLLGQLIVIDKENAISLIKKAIEMPAFSQKDNWIWPTFLLEEQIRKNCQNNGQNQLNGQDPTYEERKALFEAAVERNSQSIDLWNKLISIVSENNDEDQIRQVYRRAASKLKINLPLLIQNWIIFESTSKESKMDEVITLINQIAFNSKSPSETDQPNVSESNHDSNSDSLSKDYERRTIFVANFKDQVSEEDLLRFFSQIGEVESVRMKKSHGRTTFAFVQFRYPQHADQAVRMLNGAMFNGSQIEVKPHQLQNKLTLFIRYSTNAQPSELIEFIREKTQTTNFKLRLANEKSSPADANGPNREIPPRTKGWGFIDVTNDEDAMKIMALSGKLFKTQALKVEVANKKQKEAHFDKMNKQDKKHSNYQKKEQNTIKSANKPVQKEEEPINDEQLKDFFGL